MGRLENYALALLVALAGCVGIMAARELVEASPVAEVERCIDWCDANGRRCDCGSDVG